MIPESLALLATACLFGGMVLYSFGFAPLVFAELSGEQAGRLLRRAFPHYYLFVLATAALAALALLLVDAFSAVLMVVVFLAGLAARQLLMPAINAARDAQLAGDGTAKKRFGLLHGLSVIINFIQLGLAGWVLIRFLLA